MLNYQRVPPIKGKFINTHGIQMGQLVELQNDEPSGRFHEWWFWADLRQPEMARSTTPWIMFQTPSRIYWDSIISYWDMISYNHLLGFHLEFREWIKISVIWSWQVSCFRTYTCWKCLRTVPITCLEWSQPLITWLGYYLDTPRGSGVRNWISSTSREGMRHKRY